MVDPAQSELDLNFPHNNQGLFSNHYLDSLLPRDRRAWQSLSDEELESIYSAVRELFEDLGRDNLEGMDEASLEEHFIKPVLRLLGWQDCFDVQIGHKVIGHYRDVPDYAFFPNHDAMKSALEYQRSDPAKYFGQACAVGDAKSWTTDLDRQPRGEARLRYPAYQINAYLLDTEVKWGLLTNGRFWRLYHRERRRELTVFYECDLLRHLESGFDPDAFRYFVLFFRRAAFLPMEPGLPALLDHALKGSADYTKAVEENLKRRAFEVVETLTEGLIVTDTRSGIPTDLNINNAHNAALIFLYRLLFILYAEARGLLPLKENRSYRERYSLYALKREIKDRHDPTIRLASDSKIVFLRLVQLFRQIENGSEELGVFAYNGGLFDSSEWPVLDDPERGICDEYLERAILLLTTNESPNGRYGDFIDYRSLSVQHLGSIYEGLLELKPAWAEEEMAVIVGRNKAEFVLPAHVADADLKKYKPALEGKGKKRRPKRIPAGSVFLRTDRGERKATGTYYTPDPIVRYIVETTLGPLCDGRTREGILELKVLDPAMGSAHFLVGAVDYLAQRIMEAEPGGAEGSAIESAEDARRIVVERCIYGVDISPLAVELAKLSLWLHTIKKDRALNFLDHHLKCGNSLIGSRVDQVGVSPKKKKGGDGKQSLIFAEKLQQHLGRVIALRRQIEELPSDTAEQIAGKKRLMDDSDKELFFFKQLADLQTANYFGVETDATAFANAVYELDSREYWESKESTELFHPAIEQRNKHNFFHWELEFPELFFDDLGRPLETENAGFDAVIGNPPWDIVKPQSVWFFIKYDPTFRDLDRPAALRRMDELCKNDEISKGWEGYQEDYEHYLAFFKDNANYRLLFRGDLNLYQLFTEKKISLLKKNGFGGVVLPTGIYSDLGCKLLRKFLLESCDLKCIFAFSNERFMFRDLHHSFKFCMVAFEKGKKTEDFQGSFLFDPRVALREDELHDFFENVDEKTVSMKADYIRRFNPVSLSVMEFNNQLDVEITAKIFNDYTILGENIDSSWNVTLARELEMYKYGDYYNKSKWGIPILEGRMVQQYDAYLTKPKYWIDVEYISNEILKYKLCFRKIARSTDVRTLISLVSPKLPCGDSLPVIYFDSNPLRNSLYVQTLLNSFLMDFIIRKKVSTTLNHFYMAQLPIIRNPWCEYILLSLISRSARLSCISKEYAELWQAVFDESWNDLGIYEGRLEREWRPEFGADDFTEGRRDGPERARLRAEIDALVAHLYGLERDEFAYILDTFPVLKKYDERDFGFFRSKEWALRAYDKFAPLVAEEKKKEEK